MAKKNSSKRKCRAMERTSNEMLLDNGKRGDGQLRSSDNHCKLNDDDNKERTNEVSSTSKEKIMRSSKRDKQDKQDGTTKLQNECDHPNFDEAKLLYESLLLNSISTTTTTTTRGKKLTETNHHDDTSEESSSSSPPPSSSPSLMKMTPDGSSWLIHIPSYKPTFSSEAFEQAWDQHPKTRKTIKIFGRDVQENRWSQSYGVPYSYSGYKDDENAGGGGGGGGGGGPRSISDDPILEEFVKEIEAVIAPRDWGPYNGCLTNWYTPEDTIGPHSDDEKQLKPQSPIFTLSWGGPRRFVVKPKLNYSPCGSTVADLIVRDGDLIIMGGFLQSTHKHSVPKWRKMLDTFVPGRRISWTVRAFK